MAKKRYKIMIHYFFASFLPKYRLNSVDDVSYVPKLKATGTTQILYRSKLGTTYLYLQQIQIQI